MAELHVGSHIVILDDVDLPLVAPLSWHVNTYKERLHYAVHKNKRSVKMHRLILGVTDPKIQVDHINGNGLDNRRGNLRICTNSQNQMNARRKIGRSGFRGVKFLSDRKTRCYQARIQVSGKQFLGPIRDTADEAAADYDNLSLRFHGEFGIRNFENGAL